MTLSFYADVQFVDAIVEGMTRRGIDVLPARSDGATRFKDSPLLDRATELGRVLLTMDTDFLAEGAQRQVEEIPFSGIVYVWMWKLDIGQVVRDLEFLAFAAREEDVRNQVLYIPFA